MLHTRLITLAIAFLVIVLGTACALTSSDSGQPADATQVASQPTLHPTFTPTPVTPTPISPTGAATQTPVSQPVEEQTTTPVTQPVEEPTQTPVSQPVEEPTPTVEPSTPTPQIPQVEVTAATVNLRSGPGTNYSRVGQASQGQTFEVLARDGSGEWLQIQQPNGSNAWVINDQRWTRPIGDIMSVAVAQNIPAPPPTAKPAPTKPPAPTNTPAPSYLFVKRSNDARVNSNAIVSFFGGLYNKAQDLANPPSGYVMVAVSPNGERKETPFGNVFLRGDPGLPSEFVYNAKIEFPLAGGVFKLFVADAGGAQVSEIWEATVSGEMRTFLPRWTEK